VTGARVRAEAARTRGRAQPSEAISSLGGLRRPV